MAKHTLKTWPAFFWPVYGEVKRFEIRENDRDFKVGDYLELREWDPETLKWTGQALQVEIIYIVAGETAELFGLQPGYCVLGLGEPKPGYVTT